MVLEERSAPSEPPAGAWTDSAIPAQLLVPWTARAAGPVEHLTVAGSMNLGRIGHIDVTSTEVSSNRILESNANSLCQCPPVAYGNREAMRTTSMMGDCNASALVPLRKSSNGVLSSRVSN